MTKTTMIITHQVQVRKRRDEVWISKFQRHDEHIGKQSRKSKRRADQGMDTYELPEGTGSTERTKHPATFAYYLPLGSLGQVDGLVRARALSIKRKNSKIHYSNCHIFNLPVCDFGSLSKRTSPCASMAGARTTKRALVIAGRSLVGQIGN